MLLEGISLSIVFSSILISFKIYCVEILEEIIITSCKIKSSSVLANNSPIAICLFWALCYYNFSLGQHLKASGNDHKPMQKLIIMDILT